MWLRTYGPPKGACCLSKRLLTNFQVMTWGCGGQRGRYISCFLRFSSQPTTAARELTLKQRSANFGPWVKYSLSVNNVIRAQPFTFIYILFT